MPTRIQLRRAKGWRMPPNTVKVDRSTKWGNDFRVGEPAEYYTGHTRPVTHAEAVELHRQQAEAHASVDPDYFAELRGKNLACWCGLDEPCHADNYLKLANGKSA